MAPPVKSRVWQKCRILLRRFRICVWIFILVLLASLLYFNHVGLPDFIKNPLLAKLRAQGLDLQFARLRWRWHNGLVAEEVRLGPAGVSAGPMLSAKEVQVRLNYSTMLRLKFEVTGLLLRQGRFVLPVPSTNGSPRELIVDGIQTELHLQPGDVWELDDLKAQFLGAQLQFSGAITNATAVPQWKIFQTRRTAELGLGEKRLQQLADALERIHFSAPPQLRLDVRGDARDLSSFAVRLGLQSPGADTPWGTVHGATVGLVLDRSTSIVASHATLNLEAVDTQTQWGNATNLILKLVLLSSEPDTNIIHADLDLAADGLETKWASATNALITAEWVHSVTNAIPLAGHAECRGEDAQTQWGSAAGFHLLANLLPPTNAPAAPDESWGWWTNLAPYALDWECQVSGARTPKLTANDLLCAGEWRAPTLVLKRFSGALYRGKLNAEAELDVATRALEFSGSSDFDVSRISPLLTERSRHWLAQYAWKVPPSVKVQGSLTLPAWTNFNEADWRRDVRPTIRIEGDVQCESGSFRSVPFSYVLSHFSYSNLVWRLPNLIATRPEGRLDVSYEGSDLTHDFAFHLHSSINPQVLRPLFETNQQRAFDIPGFSRPPIVDGDIRGCWDDPDRLGGRVRIAVTNFTLRGEWAGDLQATVEYTNRLLTIIEPRLYRGTQFVSAASMVVDFPGDKIYLTNGFSTADPGFVVRVIGPKIAKQMEPYRFRDPPTARVRGVIPLHNVRDADLHFEMDGGRFEWLRFRVPRIEGRVDWVGEHLTLRNVQAGFYMGLALANAEFDFRAEHGADFFFDFAATDADLNSLMGDLTLKSNRLEGRLTGRLIVMHANSTDWQSWQGYGKLNLRDGLIWEIPIFGVLSPALDTIIPGLGSSRAREAVATYVITNGVVRSDDMKIHSGIMRLQYHGSVDLQGKVDARVQAELLRNTPVIGAVLSLALWPVTKVFEYKLSGTLREPKSEPLYFIPRMLLTPFHPSSPKGPLFDEPPAGSTNAPAGGDN